MKLTALLVIFAAAAFPLFAQTDFSGSWQLSPTKSKNIGMMAQMKLIATIRQTPTELLVTNATTFNGEDGTSEIRLDLTGKTVPNKNPMEAVADTVSKWDGPKLVTTWSSPGSIAGTTVKRTELRWLSNDGRTLTVESTRGGAPAIVMVYDRR